MLRTLLVPLVATSLWASATLTIGATALGSDGKTLTIAIGGVSGSLSPASGITGFTVKSTTNVYVISSATSSGSTVTVVLSFPIASAATVTLDLTTSATSNLTDTGGNTPTGQTGHAVTNSSVVNVLAVPYANGALKWSGCWTAGTLTRPKYSPANAQLDFAFTGTDAAVVIFANSTYTVGTPVIDAVTGSPIVATNANAYYVQSLASGLSVGSHSVSLTNSSGYYDDGTTASSGDATILIASSGTPAVAAPAGIWGVQTSVSGNAYISLEGASALSLSYCSQTAPGDFAGQGIRFTSTSSMVAVWGFKKVTGSGILLLQDGAIISTTFIPYVNDIWGRTVLASNLDTSSHEYEVVMGATNTGVGSDGTGLYLWAVELDSGTLSPVDHYPHTTDAMQGDSITGDYGVSQFTLGDQWLLTRQITHGMFRQGQLSAKVATGLNLVSAIPSAVSRLWLRWGYNDAAQGTTIGSVGSAGTFVGDYYSLIGAVRAQIGAGKLIYVEGIFPASSISSGTRTTYVNATITAVNAYLAANPTDTAVRFISTDGWIVPATDTSDGTHPNAAGYAKMAAQEVPYATLPSSQMRGAATRRGATTQR